MQNITSWCKVRRALSENERSLKTALKISVLSALSAVSLIREYFLYPKSHPLSPIDPLA
jgi:hypothetical protein